MTFDEGLSRLIEEIYKSPHDERAWRRVLEQIRTRTGSRYIVFSAVDLASKCYSKAEFFGVDSGQFLDGVEEYREHQFQNDPLLTYAARNPSAGFAESRDALSRLGRSLQDDPYMHFVAGQLGSGHNAVCYTAPNEHLTLGISINLPNTRSCFEPEQLDLLRLLFRHIERATLLAVRPPMTSYEKMPTLLLDPRGLIIAQNEGAEAVLAENDGLRSTGRRLHGTRQEDSNRIAVTIANAMAIDSPLGGGSVLAVPRPSGNPDWILTIDYLPRTETYLQHFAARTVVHIVERPLKYPRTALQKADSLFVLTPTESRLLKAFYENDLDLRMAANQSQQTYSTARVHMRRILSKADVRNQTALVRLIQNLDG
ncbi:helix-turn-helix transcriptional regulator [Novosphingobium cyanobacteriorum]|uniref:HTH luxR-type domain-containing protein n=1 Tax=Novosphingobium cyanobacteriorum TaxID=3024215 RepID=A0ABT6CIR0_9SPHN|nr:hypothetical protein [Novosphingobium cyanobacteriorum]MDF8333676.1 hypothetical protein [Novosphingobium cyanobacteriorum]